MSATWLRTQPAPPGVADVAVAYFDAFERLAASAEFAHSVWARKPMLIDAPIDGISGSFTLEDVQQAVDSDFLEAGLGVADGRGGWKMAAVSEPRGSSYEDAKLRYVDVAKAITKGTVVFNSAGAHVPKLGAICLAALHAFELPNCLNLYLTGPGLAQSAPPHTDKQDVFVLQTRGAKHWRVFEPPPPSMLPSADPLARGKGDDCLRVSDLTEPLIETVLLPGQMLYVPAGYPHTTATVSDGRHVADEASVHLTVGVDTHIWNLNLLSARQGALRKAGLPDKLVPTQLSPAKYWDAMRVPSHLGFLRRHAAEADASAAAKAAAAQLVQVARVTEPVRWDGKEEGELIAALGAAEVVAQLESHAKRMVEIQRAMYAEAMADDGSPAVPGMPRVTLFRVKPHLERLEAAMEEHLQWYGGSKPKTKAAAANSRPAAPVATGGFGGGAAAAPRKSKGSKGRKKK